MFARPGLRAFSVSADRKVDDVLCSANGLFVGSIPLLQKQSAGGGHACWTVRPIAELNNELTACYRLPVDVASKANALTLIAHALNRGDLAMAAIAAVQMQIPDPPPLANERENPDDIARRARELARSALLKFWDPAKHPRTGTPPNPGWFAPESGGSGTPNVLPVSMVDKPSRGTQDLPAGGGGGGGGNPFSDESSPRLSAPAESPSEPPAPAEPVPESPAPGEPQTTLPFPGGLPLQLAPYVSGGKTPGIFETPDGNTISLQSGSQGPAADMPPQSAGFDAYTRTHVEGEAAALMRQDGISEATVYINNPDICVRCTQLLPRMLPPGSILHVVLPDGRIVDFRGITP